MLFLVGVKNPSARYWLLSKRKRGPSAFACGPLVGVGFGVGVGVGLLVGVGVGLLVGVAVGFGVGVAVGAGVGVLVGSCVGTAVGSAGGAVSKPGVAVGSSVGVNAPSSGVVTSVGIPVGSITVFSPVVSAGVFALPQPADNIIIHASRSVTIAAPVRFNLFLFM